MFPQRFTLSLLFFFLICSFQIACAPVPAQKSMNDPSLSRRTPSQTMQISTLPYHFDRILDAYLKKLGSNTPNIDRKAVSKAARYYTLDLMKGKLVY